MSKRTDRAFIIVAVLAVAIVLAGEAITYGHPYSYDADASSDGSFSVYDSGSHVYDAILTDDGDFSAPTVFYALYDSDYGENYNDSNDALGEREMDQRSYLDQLEATLEYYGIEIVELNAEETLAMLQETDSALGRGLIIIEGAIPDIIYGTQTDSPLLSWIQAGGSLYWAGARLGEYVAYSDHTVEQVSFDYQSMFFGATCLNPEEQITEGDYYNRAGVAYNRISEEGNNYSEDLELNCNRVLYAVDTSALPTGTSYLAVGWEQDGYSSIVFLESGSGMICVLGGDYHNYQRSDLATVIAAGLTYSSTEIDHVEGQVTRGTETGKFDITGASGNCTAFIYLGGEFPVYGEAIRFTIS
jgi:hypothetical protein